MASRGTGVHEDRPGGHYFSERHGRYRRSALLRQEDRPEVHFHEWEIVRRIDIMAQRPIFLPQNTQPFSREVNIEFQWFGGFARSQQQKCIASLHDEANAREFGPTLEISSRSPTPLGVALSAFNLKVRIGGLPEATVEAVFQCSKVFASCGPFPEFLGMSGRDIKRDPRLRGSGPLKRFQLGDEEWRLSPKTALYDWIYVRALVQNSELSSQICGYNSFSDIAFNPERSLN